ncbi:hypothetical protein C0J52_07340 [Blattella germanica]|nr:hypothetical protein C0J52_07340 [Blattella germanica]
MASSKSEPALETAVESVKSEAESDDEFHPKVNCSKIDSEPGCSKVEPESTPIKFENVQIKEESESSRFSGSVKSEDEDVESKIKEEPEEMEEEDESLSGCYEMAHVEVKEEDGELLPSPDPAEKPEENKMTHSLFHAGEQAMGKRGRPSEDLDITAAPLSKRPAPTPQPVANSSFDAAGHWPVYFANKQRCKFCVKAYSRLRCTKCDKALCITKHRNCFIAYHIKYVKC